MDFIYIVLFSFFLGCERPKKLETRAVICLRSTCGLAEELEQESKGKEKTNLPKSACGSVSIISRLFYIRRNIFLILLPLNIMAVLPWRCVPMCQLSVFGNASVQTRREDSAGRQDADRCLKHWILDSERYIPSLKTTDLILNVSSGDCAETHGTSLLRGLGFVFHSEIYQCCFYI